MSNLTEDEMPSARAMRERHRRFMGTVRARQEEISRACMELMQGLNKVQPETADWRLERAVRRVARRDMLRDCRTRFRRLKGGRDAA